MVRKPPTSPPSPMTNANGDGGDHPATTPDAYSGSTSWLRDLTRESYARLSWTRRRRELQTGGKGSGGKTSLRLSTEVIADLARGGMVSQGKHQWTVATIAIGGELPVDQWHELVKQCAAWRRAQIDASPTDHPSHVFRQLEEQLPPLLAGTMGLLLLMQIHEAMEPILERCDIDTAFLAVRDCYTLLGDPETDWLQHDAEKLFGVDGPLITLGICDRPTGEWLTESLLDRAVTIHPVFCADCLGRGIQAVTDLPGVTLLRPTERLDTVVLTPAQRRIVDGIPLLWPWVTGQRHALGLLFHGPSGTGKTMLVKALAGSTGLPLLVYRPPDRHRAGRRTRAEAHGILPALLRQASRERAILFIDEADDVLPADGALSRIVLTQMEALPLVIVLATNQPLRFDPALDRRLLVKLDLGMPGPVERAVILRRELQTSAHPLDPGLLADPALDRLAESRRITGGYWRNVVALGAMIATQRADGSPAMVIDDLVAATRHQAHGESQLRRSPPSPVRWVEPLHPLTVEVAGTQRVDDLQRLVAAITTIRADRAAGGRPGIGLVLGITGADYAVVEAMVSALAHGLRLPLAWIDERSITAGCLRNAAHPRSGDADEHDRDDDEDDDDDFPGGADAYLERMSLRHRFGRHGASSPLPLMDALGEQAVVRVSLGLSAGDRRWLPLIDRLVTTTHLTLLHSAERTLPADLARRCSLCFHWGAVDDGMRQARWTALGGQGPAPLVSHSAELQAHAARQALSRLGITTPMAMSSLP